jgi:hypothetical protein
MRTAVLREAFEELCERLAELNDDAIRALTDALAADRALVVGQGPTAWVATAPDHAVRLSAAKELWDRLYGRPSQTTRLEAGGGGVLLAAVLPPDDPGHAAEVQELLERATGGGSGTTAAEGARSWSAVSAPRGTRSVARVRPPSSCDGRAPDRLVRTQ